MRSGFPEDLKLITIKRTCLRRSSSSHLPIPMPPPWHGRPVRDSQPTDRLIAAEGEELWCGIPLHKLVEEIEDQWDEREMLKGFFTIAHASNNELQHTTIRSLMQPTRETDTNLQVDAGPSLQGVEQALHGGLWSYGHLLRAVADYFEIDGRDLIMPLFGRCESVFRGLDPQLQQDTGRNDPCPCGSGRKFKRCHGR